MNLDAAATKLCELKGLDPSGVHVDHHNTVIGTNHHVAKLEIHNAVVVSEAIKHGEEFATHYLHCPFDGTLLKESGMGILFCPNCKKDMVLSHDECGGYTITFPHNPVFDI